MKVTYKTCCGVDVHKSFLVATIITTTGGIEPSYQKKRYSTFNNSILEFRQWLLDNDCHDLCMESTGKYWIPVFNLLEDEINVTIANPKWVKAVKGNKDDTKDSKWIGDLFRLGLVKAVTYLVKDSYFYASSQGIAIRLFPAVPVKRIDIRMRLRFVMSHWILLYPISLGSHPHPLLTICLNSLAILSIMKEIASKLLKSLKSKEDAVIESIEGYQMTDSQKYRMHLVRAHMDYITAEINDVDREIEKLISSDPDFENALQFLMTIPGVKRDSAITVISEIGIDMTQFSSSKRLCCWAGLTPGSNESGGKKKSVRVTRAGVYLKPALVQCAHAAVKSEKSPYYKKKYESLMKRRGKKKSHCCNRPNDSYCNLPDVINW